MVINLSQTEQAAIVNIHRAITKSMLRYDLSKSDRHILKELARKIINQKTPNHGKKETKTQNN